MAMSSDVVWIVTDEAIAVEVVPGERDGQAQRNFYASQLVKSVLTAAEKLEQGMVDFVGVVGKVLQHTKQRSTNSKNLTRFDSLEPSSMVSKLNFPSDFLVRWIKLITRKTNPRSKSRIVISIHKF